MSTEVKKDSPEPVAVTEDGTNSIVHPGDAANKAVRVNLVAGAGPSGGPSAAFDAAFPASGFAAGAKASAVAPTYGEGNMVALSVDLAGTLRTTAGGGGTGLTDAQLRASPVPVSGPLTDTQLRASAVPVSNASLPLPSGASTEATLALIKTKTDNLDVLLSSRTKPADSQNVVGTFWQATQPVSGPLTDAQLRASAVPVSGPLTDAQLRASAVPVSAAALPLPTGAATEATLAGVKTGTDRLPAQGAALTAASLPVNIASDQVVPVSASALPLPVGAATAAKQDTGNTSLASIDAKLPVQGQAQMLASVPIVIALDQVGIYDRYDRRMFESQLQAILDTQATALVTRFAEKRGMADRHGRIERGVR